MTACQSEPDIPISTKQGRIKIEQRLVDSNLFFLRTLLRPSVIQKSNTMCSQMTESELAEFRNEAPTGDSLVRQEKTILAAYANAKACDQESFYVPFRVRREVFIKLSQEMSDTEKRRLFFLRELNTDRNLAVVVAGDQPNEMLRDMQIPNMNYVLHCPVGASTPTYADELFCAIDEDTNHGAQCLAGVVAGSALGVCTLV